MEPSIILKLWLKNFISKSSSILELLDLRFKSVEIFTGLQIYIALRPDTLESYEWDQKQR